MTELPVDDLAWYSRPEARSWQAPTASAAATAFHQALPGYAATRLVEVPVLAAELGAGRVFVKDESSRFGLPAFKALGASWAIASVLADRHSLEEVTPEALRKTTAADATALVTATDGNHGRAVAHFAAMFGRTSQIVVPSFMSAPAREAIAGEGAELIEVDGTYDEAVDAAAALAEKTGGLLIQDTAWPGYEEVPQLIVDGYRTMLREVSAQLLALGLCEPSLVAVPVGVGSLAQAVVTYYRGLGDDGPTSVLSCEPDTADCVMSSLRSGAPVSVETGTTVMAGLNCGTVSSLAWPVLRDGLDAAVAVSDEAAIAAVRDLAHHGIRAGASGAASLAGARAALTGLGSETRRRELGIDEQSTVVLLSTEGSAGAGGFPA